MTVGPRPRSTRSGQVTECPVPVFGPAERRLPFYQLVDRLSLHTRDPAADEAGQRHLVDGVDVQRVPDGPERQGNSAGLPAPGKRAASGRRPARRVSAPRAGKTPRAWPSAGALGSPSRPCGTDRLARRTRDTDRRGSLRSAQLPSRDPRRGPRVRTSSGLCPLPPLALGSPLRICRSDREAEHKRFENLRSILDLIRSRCRPIRANTRKLFREYISDPGPSNLS